MLDGDWRRACPDPEEIFWPGRTVRHLNPKLSDWRGVIEAEADGEHAGEWLRERPAGDNEDWVHIRWTAGTGSRRVEGSPPMRGWFGVTAVEPLPDDPGADQLTVDAAEEARP
jgi:hypothetical protein